MLDINKEMEKREKQFNELEAKNIVLNKSLSKHRDVIVKSQEAFLKMQNELESLRKINQEGSKKEKPQVNISIFY